MYQTQHFTRLNNLLNSTSYWTQHLTGLNILLDWTVIRQLEIMNSITSYRFLLLVPNTWFYDVNFAIPSPMWLSLGSIYYVVHPKILSITLLELAVHLTYNQTYCIMFMIGKIMARSIWGFLIEICQNLSIWPMGYFKTCHSIKEW